MKTKCAALVLLCAGVLMGNLAWGAQPPIQDPRDTPEIVELRQLRSEISLLNLLNGLYLSTDQLDQLIALAERAGQVHDAHVRQYAAGSAGYVKDLAALREALYSPTGTTP